MHLRHPLDVEDDQSDAEHVVAKHLGGDRLRRADHRALMAETGGESGVEALEQFDMLGFLGGEVEQRPHPGIVAAQLRPRMVEHERQDEFLDHPEQAQIIMRPDLVEQQPLALVQPRRVGGAGKVFGQERAPEIEPPVADHLVDLPRPAGRGGKDRRIVEIMKHRVAPSSLGQAKEGMTAAATDRAEKASALMAQLKRSLRSLRFNIFVPFSNRAGPPPRQPNDPRWWEGAL